MIIDKEYPATHSMSTAWYCVDEDGNVGIFDICDYGPVPDGTDGDGNVNDMLWRDLSSKGEDGVRDLNLTMEQISPMLMPLEEPDKWEERCSEDESWVRNDSWYEVIIKIDMNKLPILIEAVSMGEDDCKKVCLSRKEGYFFVDLAYNKRGVELLEKHHVVTEKYKAPQYKDIWEDDDEELDDEDVWGEKEDPKIQEEENHRLPIFIYQEEYCPYDGPAKRMSLPKHPMKKSQLPQEIRNEITQLPLKFKDAEKIQLAEYVPVYVELVREEYVGGERWHELPSSKGETIYYGEESERVLSKEEFEKLKGTKV